MSGPDQPASTRIRPPALATFVVAAFRAVGMAAVDADATAAGLVEASRRGVPSHGVFRLEQYLESCRDGQINLAPDVKIIRGAESPAVLVDADGGYGFRPTTWAMQEAVKSARTCGIGMAGVRNSHHFGTASLYPMIAADAGLIGVATSTARARLAPTDSSEAVLGNDPFAVAIPRPAPHLPIVVDLALGAVALGKVRLAADAGQPVPEGWGFDASGQSTTDPHAIIDGGLLAAIGGAKGVGLALMCEVLAGVLTGSPFGKTSRPQHLRAGGVGHFVIAIDPASLGTRQEYDEGVEQLVAEILTATPAADSPGPRLPGLRASEHAAEVDRDGLAVSARMLAELDQLALDLGIAKLARDTS